MAKHRNWTEDEIEEAIRLYVQLPFGRIHSKNPEIISLAAAIGRTPSSIALKLTNIASIDQTLDRKGMSNASALDRSVWNKFFDQMKKLGKSFATSDEIPSSLSFSENQQADYIASPHAGGTAARVTNARLGQEFFRRMVLASYDNKCGITGIEQPELLVAGHIRTWASDAENRMNPRNGICLNRLHDKAFEEKLITIDEDYRILYSRRLMPMTKQKLISMGGSGGLKEPSRFKPEALFLREHRELFWQRELS